MSPLLYKSLSLLALTAVMPTQAVMAKSRLGSVSEFGASTRNPADWRLGISNYVVTPAAGAWHVGAQLGISAGAYLGSWGCGGSDSKIVPSLAVVCLQLGVEAHVLAEHRIRWARSSLSAQLGAGAETIFVVPTKGGESRHSTHPSAIARLGYLRDVGALGSIDMSVGAVVQGRVVGIHGPRFAPSVGLVFEGVAH